jgi:hypothetical protein
LKDERAVKSSVVCSAIQSVLKTGHPEILEHFGKAPKIVVVLVSILGDCVKAKDLDGELPKATFSLLSRLHYLTDELLQKVKFDGVEKKFKLNSNAEIRGYINTIRSNTPEGKERSRKAKDQEPKGEKQKAQQPTQDALKPRKPEESAKNGSVTSGLKRSLEPDTNAAKPNKKVASDITAIGPSQKVPAPKARTTNLFASFKKQPSKPVPTTTKTITPPAPAPVKKPEPKPEPTSTPQSSLASILASIEQPREVPKAPEAPPRPPETEEEKTKRERKESRRHLRVKWKDGAALEEVRLFRHEQAEDEGRQDNMLRDAHDDRSEGMMLKQRVLDTMPDDEDDAGGEVELRPYSDLTTIDFSTMDPEAIEKNYITTGGRLSVKSTQQQIQEQRESLELMVVYTDPRDIPPSPKEPPPAGYEKSEVERAFGQPKEPWLVQRLQEIYGYGAVNAMSLFVRRLEERKYQRQGVNAALSANSGTTTDISSILNAMNGQNSHPQQATTQLGTHPNITPEYQNQNTQPHSQLESTPLSSMEHAALANLERIVASLKGKPYPAVEPPDWMTEKGKQMWWEGYNHDKAVAGRKIAEAKAAQMQAPQTQQPQMVPARIQPQMVTPQMQYPQIPSYAVPPTSTPTPAAAPGYDFNQLQNIFAGLNGGGNNTPAPQLNSLLAGLTSGQSNPQQQAWGAAWAGANGSNNTSQSYASQNQQPRWDGSGWSNSNNDATRSSYNENSRPSYDNPTQETIKKPRGNYNPDLFTATGEYKGRKKPCKFWQEGKCAKGAACTFLHE